MILLPRLIDPIDKNWQNQTGNNSQNNEFQHIFFLRKRDFISYTRFSIILFFYAIYHSFNDLIIFEIRCQSCRILLNMLQYSKNSSSKVDWFIDAGANIVYIHPESERYVVKTLAHIKERGAFAGIAVNPDTSVASISEILNLCDYVMVMTVNPGFAGQGFIDFTRKKVAQFAGLKKEYGFKLMIDGHCSPEVIEDLSSIGADGFILGSSALFRKGRTYKELIEELRGN